MYIKNEPLKRFLIFASSIEFKVNFINKTILEQ